MTAFRALDLTGTGNIDFTGCTWARGITPLADTDLAIKSYVDAMAGGFDWKASVTVMTALALPAYTRVTNLMTAQVNGALNDVGIDGVTTLAVGNRVLITMGASNVDNGIWEILDIGSAGSKWIFQRAADANTSALVTAGMTTWVSLGSAHQKQQWSLVTADPITLNTTPLIFSQTGGQGFYTAGDGIDITGNAISVDVSDLAGTGLESDGGSPANLRIAAQGDGLQGGGGTTISIKEDGDGALNVSAAGIRVNVDDTTIEIASDAVAIKAGGVGVNEINSAIAGTGLSGGGGAALDVVFGDGAGEAVEGDRLKRGTYTVAGGAITSYQVNHNAGSANYTCHLMVGDNVNCWISAYDNNNTTFSFSASIPNDTVLRWLCLVD